MRTNRYVRLTKAGEIVYYHAKEISALYTKMHSLVDDLINHASGPLSIGASFTFGEYVLPHVIAKMNEVAPHIHPTVKIGNTEEIASYMAGHQLDVGIVEGHFKEEDQMLIESFAEDYMVMVAPPQHSLALQKGPIRISNLEQERWVLREKGSGTREASDTVFNHYDLTPSLKTSFGSTQAVKEAVGAGLGISLLSMWAIQKELTYGDLQILHVKEMPFTRKFSIVTISPYKTKAQKVFIDLLHNSKELTDLRVK